MEDETLPPATVQDFLFQGAKGCEYGTECNSGVCQFSTCVGLLGTDHEGGQLVALETLHGAIRRGDISGAEVEGELLTVVQRKGGDPLVRLRAARGLSSLHGEHLVPVFTAWLEEGDSMRYWGAVGLATYRPDKSLSVLRGTLGARSETMVLRALSVLEGMKLNEMPEEVRTLACSEQSLRIAEEATKLLEKHGEESPCEGVVN